MTAGTHEPFEVVLFDLDDQGAEIEIWRGTDEEIVESNPDDEEVVAAIEALREGRTPDDIGGGAFPRTRVRRADR